MYSRYRSVLGLVSLCLLGNGTGRLGGLHASLCHCLLKFRDKVGACGIAVVLVMVIGDSLCIMFRLRCQEVVHCIVSTLRTSTMKLTRWLLWKINPPLF